MDQNGKTKRSKGRLWTTEFTTKLVLPKSLKSINSGSETVHLGAITSELLARYQASPLRPRHPSKNVFLFGASCALWLEREVPSGPNFFCWASAAFFNTQSARFKDMCGQLEAPTAPARPVPQDNQSTWTSRVAGATLRLPWEFGATKGATNDALARPRFSCDSF